MKREMVCIVCPNGCRLTVETDGGAVTGNRCPKGVQFAAEELAHPVRTLCTTVKTLSPAMPVLPVRTAAPIPKERLFDAMAVLSTYLQRTGARCGEVIIQNLLGTGCDVIATADFE